MDLSKTLNLPRPPLPMRANLPKREPERFSRWREESLYARMREARAGAPVFLLHDGPPYANGEIHLGHALNKSLKDIIVRYRFLSGRDAPFVPGWDCHGLPIEHNVLKSLGDEAASLSRTAIRRKCREYAERFVSVQRDGFVRLGCVADWENPYLTMSREYEALVLSAFAELTDRGLVYRGHKPIHWCPSCETALAASTAEAEYAEHESDSIFVLFRPAEGGPSALVWTTTPWTLPANVALAVHPGLEYLSVELDGREFLIAEPLMPIVTAALGLEDPAGLKITGRMPGRDLVGRRFLHPFIERESVVIPADFVTTEQGTGIVHIAPGHGLEDYQAGLEHSLPVISPVDESGRFTAEAGEFEGLGVFEANPRIVELLRSKGALAASGRISHQYPHCWRCKGPVIFRATKQWFLSIDPLRRSALDAAGKVEWIPSWGEARFTSTLADRPDWCLSRQRSWGVPIPALYCRDCSETILNGSTARRAADLAAERGVEFWFDEPVETIFPDLVCPSCGSKNLEKGNDILDVWFDSGVSWFAVDWIGGGSSGRPPEGEKVADLYLEGSDQHRGWFQSSLWPAIGIQGRPPYRAVLTHGFMLDGEGRAMHKSAGNAIEVSDILEKYGADIIRLWVASGNYREDVPLSYDILDAVAQAYRKIRNTFRFLLGNLTGFDDSAAEFDPSRDFSKPVDLEGIDLWIISRLRAVLDEMRRGYESYEFNAVYRAVLDFASRDLSSIYLDVTKDRLYCEAPDSITRRSAQTVCFITTEALAVALSPILVFTAEEVYSLIPGRRNASVHLSDWPSVPEEIPEPGGEWEALIRARGDVLLAVEESRSKGLIKGSLEADVVFAPREEDRGLLAGGEDTLRDLTITSSLVLGNETRVSRTKKEKCPRCWRHLEIDTGGLCGRCREVVGRDEA